MTAIATSADGANIFLALEDTSGLPIIATAARTDLSTWTATYEPGEGDAANVEQVPGNGDRMIFFGNFGSDGSVPRVIIQYTISTDTILDISFEAGFSSVATERLVQALVVNPSDSDEIWAAVDFDVLEPFDGAPIRRWLNGAWTTLTTVGPLQKTHTALAAIFNGAYFLDQGVAAGRTSVPDNSFLFTPNEWDDLVDLASGNLETADNISGIAVGEQ